MTICVVWAGSSGDDEKILFDTIDEVNKFLFKNKEKFLYGAPEIYDPGTKKAYLTYWAINENATLNMER